MQADRGVSSAVVCVPVELNTREKLEHEFHSREYYLLGYNVW
jgi:hypothetical protein